MLLQVTFKLPWIMASVITKVQLKSDHIILNMLLIYRVGKSRFTVVSTWNRVYFCIIVYWLLYYLFVLPTPVFSAKSHFSIPNDNWSPFIDGNPCSHGASRLETQ